MRNTYLVMRQELIRTFTHRAYLLFAFGIPILVVSLTTGVRYFQGRSVGHSSSIANFAAQAPDNLVVEGFVDQSGIIQSMPSDFPPGILLAYPDEEEARRALQTDEITAYYLIPADFIDSGKVYYVYPDTKSYLTDGQGWVIQWALTTNLLDGDLELADRLWNPIWYLNEVNLAEQDPDGSEPDADCSRPNSACRSNKLVRFIPSIMVILLFFSLIVSSSMLFNSVGTEKENRTIEVVMLSIHPRQLLGGKTLGLGVAGLLQTIVWLSATFLVFNQGSLALNLPESFIFPVEILVWSLAFFIGGYLLYASLMAGAGALVPRMKESGVTSAIIIFPLFIGYIIGIYAPLGRATEMTLPVITSILPFTAPVVMVMRLADGGVPQWQILLALGLVFLTAYLAFHAVATMFRAQVLLSGQAFSLSRYLMLLTGRE